MKAKSFSRSKNKEGTLIKQTLPILNLVIICTTIICGIFVYLFALDITLNYQRNEYMVLMQTLENDMRFYGDIEWYINYWREHSDSMDISYDEKQDISIEIEKRALELAEAYEQEYNVNFYDELEKNMKLVEDEGFYYVNYNYNNIHPETLSPKLQKLLAEYVYLRVLDRFNEVKSGSNLIHLYCVTQIEGENMMYLFSGKRSTESYGEKKNNIYQLGKEEIIKESQYPSLYKTYDSGKAITSEALFHCDKTSEARYHFYLPICSDDKTLCVIGVTGEYSSAFSLFLKPYLFMVLSYIVAMIICATIVTQILIRKAINPINYIHNSVKKYVDTKNSTELESDMSRVDLNNEIGFLSQELSEMGVELTKYIEDVTKMSVEKERFNTELDLATQIQKSSLQENFTDIPDAWKVNLYGVMNPAREVGGDFYDFLQLDDDHVAFIIGDVSGKGIPASLYMMICMATFRIECKHSLEPDKIMAAVNNELCYKNMMNMFVTAWLGIFEISTGVLKTANAGHENPFIKRKDGTVEEITDKHGLVLAGMENSRYRTTEFTLGEGDMLMVYTDGVPEAINTETQQYTVNRLKDFLEKNTFATSKEYVDGVMGDINAFVNGAEQFDDTTILAIMKTVL